MIVLDASLALAWVLGEPFAPELRHLENRALAEGGIVPWLWRLEVLNSLLLAERRNRIDRFGRQAAADDLWALDIEDDLDNGEEALARAVAIAEKTGTSLYDATYLELAVRLQRPLGTLDKRLRNAAATLGVRLA